jgi:hypothetical protein
MEYWSNEVMEWAAKVAAAESRTASHWRQPNEQVVD